MRFLGSSFWVLAVIPYLLPRVMKFWSVIGMQDWHRNVSEMSVHTGLLRLVGDSSVPHLHHRKELGLLKDKESCLQKEKGSQTGQIPV